MNFKHLFFLLAIVGLVGCGDSSSNNLNGSDDTGNSNVNLPIGTADLLAEYIDAKGSYTGNEIIAPVNQTTASVFLPYVFMLVPDLLPSVYNNQELHAVAGVCFDGGHLATNKTDDEDIWLLEFNDCTDSDVVKQGSAELRVTERNPDGSVKSTTTIYKDVTFTSPDLQFKVRGKVSENSLSTTCNDTLSRSNLLFTETNTNQQIYFDDFKLLDNHRSCGPSTSGIAVHGKIYDSQLGYTSVITEKKFRTNRFYFDSETQGELILLGQDNSRFVWAVDRGNINTGDSDDPEIYHQFTLDEQGDGNFDVLLNVLDRLLIDDVFLSFEDSDNDGLLDGWEYAYGFDMFEPTDAALDADNDGYSNLIEVRYFGDPNDSESHPSVVDYSIDFSHTPSHYSNDISVELKVITDVSYELINNLTFTLTVTSPMKFTGVNSMKCNDNPTCIISEDGQQLTLFKDDTSKINSFTHFDILLDAPTEETDDITASLSATISILDPHTLESNPQNNTNQTEISRNALSADYSTQAHIHNGSRREESSNAVFNMDDMASIDMSIIQIEKHTEEDYFFDEIPNGYFELIMPDFIESAEVVCTTDIEVCQTGNFIYMAPQDRWNEFTLHLTANATGRGYIKVNVKSFDTGEKIFNQFNFPVIVGQRTEIIQEKIDAAIPGATVIVEPGIYVGDLNLANQQVHVKSGQGPENTFIYGDSTLNSEINLGYGSSLSGFTIAQYILSTLNETNDFYNNRLEGREFALKGVRFDLQGNLNINQNFLDYRTANDSILPSRIGGRYSDIRCESINIHNDDVVINLSNNIFIGNAAWEVLGSYNSRKELCAIFRTSPPNLKMVNNTITGFHSIFDYTILPNSENEALLTLDFSNNLISKTQYVFDVVSYETVAFPERTKISIRNNLLFNSEAIVNPITEPGSPAIVQLVHPKNTITADPLLTESFQLSSESPAIDAGLDTGLTLDFSSNPRPVDGNGDGSAEYDIGASEWQVDPSP